MVKHPLAFPDYFPLETKSIIVRPDFIGLGVGISTSNDLGYTYGRVTSMIQVDNSLSPYTANFLRVWKYEKNEWKIVVEVISGAQ